MRNVLVTGGAGFIGSHLVDRLVQDGDRVTVLDNLSTGSEGNLSQAARHRAFRLVRASVLEAELVDDLVRTNDLVFHLAAAVGVTHIVRDPLGTILTNVRGTENVLASAHRRGARVLLASTSEVYGRSETVPFTEDGPRVLGPTWIHRWAYSTAKAIDEHLAFAYAERGLRMSIVRYFNAYGPRIDESGYGTVIARFAAQALKNEPLTVHGDGMQTRCFTYIDDTIRGTLLAAEREEAVGRVFNIGIQREITILDLAHLVRETLDSSSPVAMVPYESYYPKGFQDTRRRVPDVTHARERLGFVARVALEEGLPLTLAWCADNYRLVGA